MFFKDPLMVATNNLLDSVKKVAAALMEKKQIIEDAKLSVEEANRAIDEAQKALESR